MFIARIHARIISGTRGSVKDSEKVYHCGHHRGKDVDPKGCEQDGGKVLREPFRKWRP